MAANEAKVGQGITLSGSITTLAFPCLHVAFLWLSEYALHGARTYTVTGPDGVECSLSGHNGTGHVPIERRNKQIYKDMTTRLKSACKAGILVAACVSLAICSSCSDEDMMNSSGQSDKLSFGVSISDKWETAPGTRSTAGETPERSAFKFDGSDLWLIATSEEGMDSTLFTKPGKAQTRAAAVTTESFNSFGVYAYVYEGDDWASGQNVKPYFTAEKVTKSNGNLWTTSPTRFWPGEQYRMQFFACAPYDITQNVTVNDNTSKLDYTVPDDVKDQKDLIVATADVRGNYNSSLPLKFKHILTAVKVKAAEGVSGTITKVALTGIKNTGNYTFGGTEWSNLDGSASFVQEFNPGKELDGSEETFVVDGDNTFMMIPQTLGENAALQITFSDGTVLTGSLFGKTDWEMWHTVIYKISRTGEEYILEVTDPTNSEYTSSLKNTPSFTVKSYKRNTSNIETAVKWNLKYWDESTQEWNIFTKRASEYQEYVNYDNSYKNYYTSESFPWCAVKYISHTGGSTDYRVSIRLQNHSKEYSWDKEYQIDLNKEWRSDVSIGSTNSPIDLSKYDFYKDNHDNYKSSPVNTANCYVIRHPGIYMLPLVYGNKIKNGSVNNNGFDKTFIENANFPILVWQDEKSLIKSVGIKKNGANIDNRDVDCLYFETADASTINQGNAIVAVKDASGSILWSWHIWVTNDPGVTQFTTIENYSGKTFSLAGLNLGLCNAIHYEFPERSITLRVEQEDSGKSHIFTIKQMPMNLLNEFNYTFYQWGRKDPIIGFTAPPKDVVNYQEKTRYDIDNKEISFSTREVQHDDAYKYPSDFISSWSPIITDWNKTKTVYDPCPVGMRIPDEDTFTGITYNGQSHSGNSEIDGMWTFLSNGESYKEDRTGCTNSPTLYYGQVKNEEHGFWFYCNKMNAKGQWDTSRSMYFMPSYASRYPNGTLYSHFAYYFTLNRTLTELQYNCIKLQSNVSSAIGGGTIRPVKDE